VITVLVVDDHARVRDSLADLLSSTGDMVVVGQCADGDEVLDADRRLRPDVVLMDVAMQRTDGLSATEVVVSERPDARVVILTGSVSGSLVRRAAEVGAVGYQLKGENPGDLIDAVRTVAQGGTAWSNGAMAFLSPPDESRDASKGATNP
jgi:DNA-binding NarL/FixJ family response regulator